MYHVDRNHISWDCLVWGYNKNLLNSLWQKTTPSLPKACFWLVPWWQFWFNVRGKKQITFNHIFEPVWADIRIHFWQHLCLPTYATFINPCIWYFNTSLILTKIQDVFLNKTKYFRLRRLSIESVFFQSGSHSISSLNISIKSQDDSI